MILVKMILHEATKFLLNACMNLLKIEIIMMYDSGEVFTDYNNNGVRDDAKEINFKLNPTISNAYLRVQDVMILQLINDMPIDVLFILQLYLTIVC